MKITNKQLKEYIKEEISLVLKEEEDKSTWDKLKYLPADFFSAIERKIRKETGIRGVMDPSVVTDSDGNLIMPQYSKKPEWQKKNPEAWAALQTAANIFASDPFTLASWFVGGAAIKGAAGLATKGLSKVSPELANIASKELPSLGKALSSLKTNEVPTPNIVKAGGSIYKEIYKSAMNAMKTHNVPKEIRVAVSNMYDLYMNGLINQASRSIAKNRIISALRTTLSNPKATELEIRAYQQFMDSTSAKFPELKIDFTDAMRNAVNDKLLRIYTNPELVSLRMDPKIFNGSSYITNGGIHNFHLLPQEELPKLKDVITGTHMVDWTREIPRVVKKLPLSK